MVTETAKLLEWSRSLQAIAQSGLAYEPGVYDRERYVEVRRIAAEMLAQHTGLDADGVVSQFANQTGHATPKVDVRGAVFRDDSILLVQESVDEGWSLPGGWVDVGELPSEAVVREVLEESGYRTVARKLIALYDRDRHAPTPHVWHIWKAIFLCELTGDEQVALGTETVKSEFFHYEALPDLVFSRASQWHLDRCYAHHADPGLPTEFD
jgi:ADP-ribose pyrophosphatase YjhB (NUDIX family)